MGLMQKLAVGASGLAVVAASAVAQPQEGSQNPYGMPDNAPPFSQRNNQGVMSPDVIAALNLDRSSRYINILADHVACNRLFNTLSARNPSFGTPSEINELRERNGSVGISSRACGTVVAHPMDTGLRTSERIGLSLALLEAHRSVMPDLVNAVSRSMPNGNSLIDTATLGPDLGRIARKFSGLTEGVMPFVEFRVTHGEKLMVPTPQQRIPGMIQSELLDVRPEYQGQPRAIIPAPAANRPISRP
jgi:hypothetical protein